MYTSLSLYSVSILCLFGMSFSRRWQGFKDDYTNMVFEQGDKCWNGPERSLRVHYSFTSPSLGLIDSKLNFSICPGLCRLVQNVCLELKFCVLFR